MKIMNAQDLRYAVENARLRYPTEVVRLELYRLACIFYASKRFRDLSDGSDHCPYQPLRDDFEKSEIARILILIGSAGRLLCDDLKKLGHESVARKNVVGVVTDDVQRGGERQLNVLEVCSKILHAKVIVPKVRYQGNPYRQYLVPKIELHSDDTRKVGWKALIVVDDLVAGFSNLT